jgi:hypothetical protein
LLKYSVPLLNAVSVFILGSARLNWPSQDFWSNRVQLGCLAASLVLTVIQTMRQDRGEKARRVELETENAVKEVLGGSLAFLATYCGADWQTTSLQVFVVKRAWFPSWKPWEWGSEKQVRLAKVRLLPSTSSGINWTKGKGLIGVCWTTRAPQWEWLNLKFAPYNNYTREDWATKVTPERVFLLTYDDYQTIKGKYGLVAAVPILDANDRYIGCISMDTPVTDPPASIDRGKAMAFLMNTGNVVENLLARKAS